MAIAKSKGAPAAPRATKTSAKAPSAEGKRVRKGALVIGAQAPDFSLPDEAGKPFSLASVRGKKVVLFFYPKDDTPGCTRQSCAFQEDLSALAKLGAVVIGVSRDGAASHQRFKTKYGLAFPLLTDGERVAHLAYGAWGTKMMYGKPVEGVIRTTVVIARGGAVAAVFSPVKVDGHAEKVRAVVASLA